MGPSAEPSPSRRRPGVNRVPAAGAPQPSQQVGSRCIARRPHPISSDLTPTREESSCSRTCVRPSPGLRRCDRLVAFAAGTLHAQRVVTQAERVVSITRGGSALLVNPLPISRFSVGDPSVAEAIVLSPTEVLINGKGLGTTTLLIWDNSGQVRVNSVEVTADAPGLQRFLKQLMPDEDIQVSASGNTVTVSGTVKDPNSVARAIEIAKGSGATIIDNLVAPQAVQVLVRVRFAEINRTALKDWSTRFSTLNPHKLSDDGDWSGTTDPTVGRRRHHLPAQQRATPTSGPSSRPPPRRATCGRWPSRT